LAAADFSQAIGLIEQDNASDALAYLVRSLRNNPANTAALTRLTTLLTYHTWMLPAVVLKNAGEVFVAQFSPDGKRFVTISRDGAARIWEAETGNPVTKPLQHDTQARSAQFSSDGRHMVTVSKPNIAVIWDLQTGQSISFTDGTNMASAHFSPDGK